MPWCQLTLSHLGGGPGFAFTTFWRPRIWLLRPESIHCVRWLHLRFYWTISFSNFTECCFHSHSWLLNRREVPPMRFMPLNWRLVLAHSAAVVTTTQHSFSPLNCADMLVSFLITLPATVIFLAAKQRSDFSFLAAFACFLPGPLLFSEIPELLMNLAEALLLGRRLSLAP